MFIDHDTASNEYIVMCDKCNTKWVFEGNELFLQPWPHFECPKCGEWIPAF